MELRRSGWRQTLPVGVLVVALAVGALIAGRHGSSPLPPPVTPAPTSGPTEPPPVLALPQPAPAGRMLATWATDPVHAQTVLFGGIAQSGASGRLADTWVFNGGGWSTPPPTAAPPAADHTVATFDPSGRRIVLVTGPADGPPQTWAWILDAWHRLPDSLPAGTVPQFAATAAGNAVLVAGADGRPALSTWRLVGDAWQPAAGESATPQAIRLFAGETSGDAIALTLAGPPGPAATWRWDGTRWQRLPAPGGVAIEPLTATMTGAPSGGVVLVELDFRDEHGDHGGTWTWDGRRWTRHAGTLPNVLRAFDVTEPVFTSVGGRVLLLGGVRRDESYREMWAWDGTRWLQQGAPG